jgi:uncharacterized protein (UPF0333 family)
MKQGQISIDLLITLIVAIIAVGAMGAIITTYSEAQERSTIQQQLQYDASKTASLITASQALSDTNFRIEARIGTIIYSDENKNYRSVYPDMNIIDNNKLNLSLMINGQRQDANAYFFKDDKTRITPLEKTTGTVVITNAQ